MAGSLNVRMDGHIAIVTLERGKNNLFDYTVYNDFKETFENLSDDKNVVAVVLDSAGKNFTMGHEMPELAKICQENIDEHYRIVGEGLAAIYLCQKPTVAAARGIVAGAGLAAIACCDMIVASHTAQFMMPEIKAGIVGCAEFLELLLPKGLARYYAYTGKAIPVYDIYRTGGIFEMAQEKDLAKRALEIAKEVSQAAAPDELRYYKGYMNDIDGNDLLGKFYMGKKYGKQFLNSPNNPELYNAFFEKRPYKFEIL